MAEAVRLVIWDLDETFWKGTVTEGGISEYIEMHHDIVIELARRGILSSICSKNDYNCIRDILVARKIWDYFVFPSVNWMPKGVRLSHLIDAVQLRAPTVMFIDDNPNNRAEATAAVPGIQVEDERFIPSILLDPRFKGKDDSSLSRLKQYKLLEERASDQESSVSSNEDFLRNCDVRVYIEFDVEPHIDRAIELINRTNQLNYTKIRLPENLDHARKILSAELRYYDRQAGLVHVADRYGDYGFVGFFMTQIMRRKIVDGASNGSFVHFCFSCRTLGMFVEQWLYQHLGQPELDIVGEVLTDLSVPRAIDWVRQVQSIESTAPAMPQVASQIVLWGGCETQSVGVYLAAYTEKLETYGNYIAGSCFVRIASVVHASSICTNSRDAVEADANAIGLPIEMVARDVFATTAHGAVFVFNFGLDAHWSPYARHKTNGMTIDIGPRHMPNGNFLALSESDIMSHLETSRHQYDTEQRQNIIAIARYMRDNFEFMIPPSESERVQMVHDLIQRIPSGGKFIIALDHDEGAEPDQDRPGEIVTVPLPMRTHWGQLMRNVAACYPYVGVVSYSEVIRGPHEILGAGNHYAREVYLRFATRLVDLISSLQPR